MIAEDEDPAEPANGMFRNSANAAWISAMFADLPGVTPVQSKLARCMALQTVNFLLGLNPAEISFQVGVGKYAPLATPAALQRPAAVQHCGPIGDCDCCG